MSRSTIIVGALGIALLGPAAHAQAPAPSPAQEPEYVRIAMEIDIDRPAAEVWEKVGGYCDISVWANGLACEITSGDGGMGTVRSLFGGRIIEVLVAQTDLSYGYAQPAGDGFYDLYHGFMEAKPVTATTSKMLYTLMYDVSNLADQAAKDADMARRRTQFEGLLANMKALAEGE